MEKSFKLGHYRDPSFDAFHPLRALFASFACRQRQTCFPVNFDSTVVIANILSLDRTKAFTTC